MRELAESGGSNMVTIEKYVRQSFAGASEVNLSKLLRLAAHKAVTKVSPSNFLLFFFVLIYFTLLLIHTICSLFKKVSQYVNTVMNRFIDR